MSVAKKRGLGRGLGDLGVGELLGTINLAEEKQPASQQSNVEQGPFRQLPISQLSPGRFQPRRQFDAEKLQELADSIKAQGIIQPVVVRATGDHSYELIAGERRWRAAEIAGLTEIPALIRELDDRQAVAVALIENIQRRELNAIEEAQALQRLIEEFAMTHQQIADTLGKSRAMVTNLLRLLKLNPDVRLMVERGQLEMGHARALLAIDGVKQSRLAKRIVDEHLSVREIEELIRHMHQVENMQNSHGAEKSKPDADLLALQRQLTRNLGMKVQIRQRADGRGKLVINYKDQDEFARIMERVSVES